MTAAAQPAKPQEKASAPEIDSWTHRLGGLVERFPRFWIHMGNWESRLLEEPLSDVAIDRPIYVTGLARSGSTILLELLARHAETAAHHYRDFPMVLTPWMWNWFVDRAGRQDHEATERAHRDRIKVTPESPEAFEEVLWMAFFQHLHDPSRSSVLDDTVSHPRFEEFYRDHIRKIIALRQASRYLAKGNYNVTRLRYLKKLFPDARFIIPIRDPVWHIASLMKQHRLFVASEGEDRRVLDHMRRSGHFEFGLNRRPINTGDNRTAREIAELWQAGEEVAGWATYWASVYGHIAGELEAPDLAEATLVVRYEDICGDPATELAKILNHCALEDDGLIDFARATVSAPAYYKPSFTEAEHQTIRLRTGAVAKLYGYT